MPSIRATAEATVTAKPDRAEISIFLLAQSSTAQAAAAANASQTAELIEVFKRTFAARVELKTTGYSLTPQYQTSTVRATKITGFQAAITVLVVVTDLAVLGQVIDAASAHSINAISYSLKDEAAPRAQALSEAALKARAAAEDVAKSLGLQPLTILEAQTDALTLTHPGSGDLNFHAKVTVTLQA